MRGMDHSCATLLLKWCSDAGFTQCVQLSYLDDDDIEDISKAMNLDKAFITDAVAKAKDAAEGWATQIAMSLEYSRRPNVATPVIVAPSSSPSSSLSLRANANFVKYVKGAVLQARLKGTSMKTAPQLDSLESLEQEAMAMAIAKVHLVFLECAPSSKRITYLRSATDIELALQMDVYRGTSISPVYIRKQACWLLTFFTDLLALKWDLATLTEWRVASWVRSKISSGSKSAQSTCNCTLKLVQSATDDKTFWDHPLVAGQLRKASTIQNTAPTPAKALSFEVIEILEEVIINGRTAQDRCMAGFFVCLTHASARTWDLQRSRNLSLTMDALKGESLMKKKNVWVEWFVDKNGFSGLPWGESWLKELNNEDLPRSDYLLYTPNTAMNDWIHKPARYSDFQRSLHTLLMAYCGLSSDEAVEHNPHGFRHLLIIAAQQLRAVGKLQRSDIHILGKWAPGSKMPERYDTEAGVSELKARVTISRAVRKGWRPVANGNLPSKLYTAASKCVKKKLKPSLKSVTASLPAMLGREGPASVGHKRRYKIHRSAFGTGVSLCGFWSCGTLLAPHVSSLWSNIPLTWEKCPTCWR